MSDRKLDLMICMRQYILEKEPKLNISFDLCFMFLLVLYLVSKFFLSCLFRVVVFLSSRQNLLY